jgi:hypothetical protein
MKYSSLQRTLIVGGVVFCIFLLRAMSALAEADSPNQGGAQENSDKRAAMTLKYPSRRFFDEDGINIFDTSGARIAAIRNLMLILTYDASDNGRRHPHFYVSYDFDNVTGGGGYGKAQFIYVDLVDSQGNVIETILKIDVSQSACLHKAVALSGNLNFMWENVNIQRIELRAAPADIPSHQC